MEPDEKDGPILAVTTFLQEALADETWVLVVALPDETDETGTRVIGVRIISSMHDRRRVLSLLDHVANDPGPREEAENV